MSTKFRRMSGSDVKLIVAELDRWAAGQLGAKLTWGILEDRFGFSRQSLQAKTEVKAAYDFAKKSLAGGLMIIRDQASNDVEALQLEVQRLKLEVAEYKRREMLWQERWQRIAYNIRQRGMQIFKVDDLIKIPDYEKYTSKDLLGVLNPYDFPL